MLNLVLLNAELISGERLLSSLVSVSISTLILQTFNFGFTHQQPATAGHRRSATYTRCPTSSLCQLPPNNLEQVNYMIPGREGEKTLRRNRSDTLLPWLHLSPCCPAITGGGGACSLQLSQHILADSDQTVLLQNKNKYMFIR